MKGSKVHEHETDVPASELWAIYGTLRAAELLPQLLPQVLTKADVVSGDGGVGTILQLTFPPGERNFICFFLMKTGGESPHTVLH
jgi:hypothetical protein